MEAGRGSRRRTSLTGEDSLVAFEVALLLRAAADVAGQRHAAHAGEQRGERFGDFGHGQPRSSLGAAHEPDRHRIGPVAVGEHHPLAERRPPAGAGEQLPAAARRIDPQEEPFPSATGLLAAADQPGGHDPRVVDDDKVSRPQDLW